MEQQYTYYTRWVKNIVAIIHIYGATAIFTLFEITQPLNLSAEKW